MGSLMGEGAELGGSFVHGFAMSSAGLYYTAPLPVSARARLGVWSMSCDLRPERISRLPKIQFDGCLPWLT
jgi:hypothetical protein